MKKNLTPYLLTSHPQALISIVTTHYNSQHDKYFQGRPLGLKSRGAELGGAENFGVY